MPGGPRACPAGCTRKRDHGGLLFIDLRDHYGITQCVFPAGSPAFAAADAAPPGERRHRHRHRGAARADGTVNPRLPTGEIELRVEMLEVQSAAEVLPIQVAGEEKYPEDLRLTYRFLDLRREKLHRNIMLRAGVIASIRRRMIDAGFTEFQTPILTASVARGRARLPGAGAAAPGQVLRPAAGAAAVQAVADGRGLRPLFPDRALLPRRGRARRPFARASSTSSISR